MDRQDPGATSLEDEPGEKIEDTQGYLTEMKRKLFGSGDLDVNGTPRSGIEGIGQTGVVQCVPATQEQYVGGLKWRVTRFTLDRAISHIRQATAIGSDGTPAGLIKQLGEGAKAQLAGLFTNNIAGAPIPTGWQHGRVVLAKKKGRNP